MPRITWPVPEWNVIIGATNAAVSVPPKNPYRSTNNTLAPKRAALTALHTPDEPPPTTTTS